MKSRRKFVGLLIGLLAGCSTDIRNSGQSSTQSKTQTSSPTPSPTSTVAEKIPEDAPGRERFSGITLRSLGEKISFGPGTITYNDAILTKNTIRGTGIAENENLSPGDTRPESDREYEDPQLLLVHVTIESEEQIKLGEAATMSSFSPEQNTNVMFNNEAYTWSSAKSIPWEFTIEERDLAGKAFASDWGDGFEAISTEDDIPLGVFQGTASGWWVYNVPNNFKKEWAALRFFYHIDSQFMDIVETVYLG